jgi:hypothetical protein
MPSTIIVDNNPTRPLVRRPRANSSVAGSLGAVFQVERWQDPRRLLSHDLFRAEHTRTVQGA